MSRTFAALSIPNYRIFASGSLVSNVGTWMQRVAQDWLILELAGGGRALGVIAGLQFLPTLALSPIAGLLADRVARRRLLVVSQSTMAASAAALGLLAISEKATVTHVYVLALVFGVGSAFDIPARQAFVAELVDRHRLPNAIALNSASVNIARMIGPAVAGGLIAALGAGVVSTGWVILLNAFSYVAVVASLFATRRAELVPFEPIGRGRGQLRAGFRYVRQSPPILQVLAVVFCIGAFGLHFQITTLLMVTEVFDRGPAEVGALGSLIAIGSLCGSLAAARRESVRQRHLLIAAVTFGATEVLLGMMPTYLSFAFVLPICGGAAFTAFTSASALVQMSSEVSMRGRVLSIYMMVFLGGTPLGAPAAGWVAERFGPRSALIVGGGLTAAGTVIAAALCGPMQGVRRMRRPEQSDRSRDWRQVAHADCLDPTTGPVDEGSAVRRARRIRGRNAH